MRLQQHITTKLTACGLALMLASFVTGLAAQTVKQGTARVARIEGKARYSTGHNIWQDLKVGTVLRAGTVIQTAANSQVDLILSDGPGGPTPRAAVGTLVYRPAETKTKQNLVRMRENTLLALDKLTWEQTGVDVVTETQLDLRAGRIFGSVPKLSGASKYEIKLPNGVAGIRGTVYDIDDKGVLSVHSGIMVLAFVSPDGTVSTQVVTAGQQFDPRTGQITTIPEDRQRAAIREPREAALVPGFMPQKDYTVLYIDPEVGVVSTNRIGF